MSKLFCLMGKSASGKDTIFKHLISDPELGLKTIVSYTTRPMREGEKEGIEYHFVSRDDLERLKQEGKVIECRDYHTVHGIWSYFMADDGQIDFSRETHQIVIGTPESYAQLVAYFGASHVVPIYIHVDDGIRLQRAVAREQQQKEPKYEELCRRFLADAKDFSDEKLRAVGIEKQYENDRMERCLEEIRQMLLKQ